jgi:kanosamine-6-phosphate phosphatase
MKPLGDRAMYLPRVEAPRWVVFADFDETYLAHDGAPERRRDRRALEQLLIEEARARGIVFGWVADGPIEDVAEAVGAHGLRVVPHFLASSRGAEMELFSREGGRRQVPEWDARFAMTTFSRARASAAAFDLERRGLRLEKRARSGRRIERYRMEPTRVARMGEIFAWVRQAAERHGIAAYAGPCHPAIEGQDGGYEIDFIPRGAGKRHVVEFVLERLGLPRGRALAFGDDVADLEMLHAVEHGYLVDNATDEVRRRFSRTAGSSYARGILDVIERRIEPPIAFA